MRVYTLHLPIHGLQFELADSNRGNADSLDEIDAMIMRRKRVADAWPSCEMDVVKHQQLYRQDVTVPASMERTDFALAGVFISGPIVSERVKQTLSSKFHSCDVEFLPLAGEATGYYVLNMLEAVDCLDLDGAGYTGADGRIESIHEWVFAADSFRDGVPALFKEFHSGTFMASGDFVAALEGASFTGAEFRLRGEV